MSIPDCVIGFRTDEGRVKLQALMDTVGYVHDRLRLWNADGFGVRFKCGVVHCRAGAHTRYTGGTFPALPTMYIEDVVPRKATSLRYRGRYTEVGYTCPVLKQVYVGGRTYYRIAARYAPRGYVTVTEGPEWEVIYDE